MPQTVTIDELLNMVNRMNETFKPIGFKWKIDYSNEQHFRLVKFIDEKRTIVLTKPLRKNELYEWIFAYRYGMQEFQSQQSEKKIPPHLFPVDCWTGRMRVAMFDKKKDPAINWKCQLVLEYLKHRAEGQSERKWDVYGKHPRETGHPKKMKSREI